MAVEAILFMDDKFHSSNTTAEVDGYTGSNENGYAGDNVREVEFGTAWKPADDSSDHAIRLDFNNTTTLGTAGTTGYCCIAYDARVAEQNTILLQYDSADSSGFAGATTLSTFTLNKARPSCQFASFTIPTPAKRYYRLLERNADRAGGTKTVKIFNWGMFAGAGGFRIGTDYGLDTTGPGDLDHVSDVQAILTEAQCRFTNRMGFPKQEVELSFRPASLALWEALRDKVYGLDGPRRAFYAQFDGLRNPAQQDFFMVRMVGERATGSRNDRDQYEVTVLLETEVCF